MTDTLPKSIIGVWRKRGDRPCDRPYPDEIEFLEGGVYRIALDDDRFSLWSSGDYEFLAADTIRIQTANDAMLPYRVRRQDDETLVFVDEDDCEFSYQRRL